MRYRIYIITLILCALVGCREEKYVLTPEEQVVGDTALVYQRDITGFYLLNEGNMGSNKATLDHYDYVTGVYTRNIYASANPSMVQELGDVGNDLQIYGSRMYGVINCSNFIEVMDVHSTRHIGTVNVPNCRYVKFSGQYGYVSSYAGPVKMDPSYEQIGYVAKFDTASLQIVATCNVGFQPEEIEIVGNRMYVANSGGYMAPNYETTVSVIDMDSFTELKRIEVAPNLHRLRADKKGNLWVSSRGDYYDIPSRLFCLDLATELVTDTVPVAVSDLCMCGDSLYVIGSEFSYVTYESTVSYTIVDVDSHTVVNEKFITDGTDALIKVPYAVSVNPQNGDVFITDAKNYVSPGKLYCFGRDGAQKWSVVTGDIPAHIAFTYEIHNNYD
ncbi:MAG: YncE family protein [Bacteroidales bacterium]|nr:YncE family protein [Bacteroidales bacterium]